MRRRNQYGIYSRSGTNVYLMKRAVLVENSTTKVFLDKLLKLNEEGADFTEEDLKDEVITMTVAVIIIIY